MSTTGLLTFLSAVPILSFLGIAAYIMYSMGLYSMARNTGVSPAIFAWIPLLRLYTLGQIADRYNGSIGKGSSYRFLLPVLRLLEWVLLFLSLSSLIIGFAFGGVLVLLACGLLQTLIFILEQLCYYKTFCDFEPEKSILYLIFSVFGLEWIALFLCRNNMPVGVAGHQYPRQPRYTEL